MKICVFFKLIKTCIPQRSGKKWEKFEKNKFRFQKKKNRLQNRYQNWTLVSVLDTKTEFRPHTTSPTIDLFLKLGFHGACYIYAILAFLCAFWGAATIPDNRGKSLVKVEEFYENKSKNPNKMNIWKYIHNRYKQPYQDSKYYWRIC